MIMIIDLSKNINHLPEVVVNWNDINEKAKEFMLSGTHYRLYSNTELLIYRERKIIASCSYICFNNKTIEVENCWTENGNLFE